MQFSSFFAPLLLVAGQTTLISAVLTPDEILNRIQDASSDVSDAINDVSNINAVDATIDYNTIVQDSDNLGNELNEDNNDIQGSAIFDETSENVVGEGFNDLTTNLVNYFKALQGKAADFIVPSEKSAIVASGTALKNGAQSFLNAVADLTTDPELNGAEEENTDSVVDAYNAFADAFGAGA